jgi:hypothetical protein
VECRFFRWSDFHLELHIRLPCWNLTLIEEMDW